MQAKPYVVGKILLLVFVVLFVLLPAEVQTSPSIYHINAQTEEPVPTVTPGDEDDLVEAIEAVAVPLNHTLGDYDPLMALIGDARFVLIGEASHGTHEFYKARADISRRLIVEKGFDAVIVEGDWPDAYRVNEYVRAVGDDLSPEAALSGFTRFPLWMWQNTVVRNFVEWLRGFNMGVAGEVSDVGFYGLDLYSMHESTEAVAEILDAFDPEAAERAQERYSCLAGFEEDPFRYGLAVTSGQHPGCEEAVTEQLIEIEAMYENEALADTATRDLLFNALQNARLVKNAERYYRPDASFSSWNWRDQHMFATMEALVAHLTEEDDPAKIVVWAHNSHLGDARATERTTIGELNLGQLVREAYGEDAVLIGFSTYTGTVTAVSAWDAAAERKYVRPTLEASYAALFHKVALGDFLIIFRDNETVQTLLSEPRLQRAIGVIYRPQTERVSHYYFVELPDQFDALIYFDETHALEPLEPTSEWVEGEAVPEGLPGMP